MPLKQNPPMNFGPKPTNAANNPAANGGQKPPAPPKTPATTTANKHGSK